MNLKATMNGMTNAELARQLGVSRAAVTQWVNGATPKPEMQERIAEVLGVSVTKLNKITVEDAAKMLNISTKSLRLGLQQGAVPFGAAWQGSGGRWVYVIYPEKLKEAVGNG